VRTHFKQAARMAATARVNIAVPPALKERMGAVTASNVIRPNWSAIFRERAEAELAKLERGDEAAAIARLRASRLESEQFDLKDGKAHGRAWAEQTAEYCAFKRLTKGAAQYQNLWDYPWDCLCKAVDPRDLFTDGELSIHLFGDQFSDRREYETYLKAFIEGAIERWRQLAPHVEAHNDTAQEDYLPELGPCVASTATGTSTEPELKKNGEPPETATPSRRNGWRPIDAITQAVRDAAGITALGKTQA
jgi:hypothetical protein